MNRTLAVLTIGALLTLLIGVVASGKSLPSLALGTVFTAMATAGTSVSKSGPAEPPPEAEQGGYSSVRNDEA